MTDCPFNRLTSAPIPNEVSQTCAIGAVGIAVSDDRATSYIIVGCPVDVGRLPMPLFKVRVCFRGPSSIIVSTWPSLGLLPSAEDS